MYRWTNLLNEITIPRFSASSARHQSQRAKKMPPSFEGLEASLMVFHIVQSHEEAEPSCSTPKDSHEIWKRIGEELGLNVLT